MLIRDMGFSARLVSTSWPYFEAYCQIVSFWAFKLIVFAFSNNLSAENSKLSAEFVLQLLQLLECMDGHLILTRSKITS